MFQRGEDRDSNREAFMRVYGGGGGMEKSAPHWLLGGDLVSVAIIENVQDEWRAEHRSNDAVFSNPSQAVNISCAGGVTKKLSLRVFLSYTQFKRVMGDKGLAENQA